MPLPSYFLLLAFTYTLRVHLAVAIQIPIGIHDKEQQIVSSGDDHNLEMPKTADFLRYKIRQQRQKMKTHYLSSNTRAMDDGTSKRLYPMWNLSVLCS